MNATNIEIKAKCSDLDKIREILNAKQARFVGVDHQVDTYFNVSHGRLKLREGNIENALIHYSRTNQTGPKKSEVILYKSAPYSSLKDILQTSLGTLAIVDKKREIYFIENVKFHLDKVKNLGTFVEIEAIDSNGSKTVEELKAQCKYYLDLFEIEDKQLIQNSYSDLIKIVKRYNAKILLFGEYTIINGGQALAIPITQFGGEWAFVQNSQPNDFQSDLEKFADYLDELNKNDDLIADIEVEKFKYELQKGLFFKSNIPHGYGAGSSGALCAAIYDRFSTKKEDLDLWTLRKKLAQLESFFHGSSSGIDPLISYLNQPVLIKSNDNQIVKLPDLNFSNETMFLLDTGISRKTAPFVKIFLEKYNQEKFAVACKDQLAVFNENAIRTFLSGDWSGLFENMDKISLFQLEYFKEMIPDSFSALWKEGLNSDYFKLKLCGAGGGGFILGITKDFEKMTLNHPNKKMIPILRF